MKSPLALSGPAVRDIVLHCSDGLQLAAQVYTTTPPLPYTLPRRILCLHGWMDNCRSFHLLAPSLLRQWEASVELVALDLPGHGWSSHRSADGPPVQLADAIFYVAEAVRQLQWWDPAVASRDEETGGEQAPFTLVGHSMGAAISCLYAAAFPEQIDKLVLLEGGTLMPTPEDGFVPVLLLLLFVWTLTIPPRPLPRSRSPRTPRPRHRPTRATERTETTMQYCQATAHIPVLIARGCRTYANGHQVPRPAIFE
jgi:pimeloyl-ACP methyl ester carboxylesterase